MVETRRTSASGRAGSHRLSMEDLSPRLEATMDLIARTMANRREQRAAMDEAAMREAAAQRQHAEDYNNNAANSMIQGGITGATIGSMIPVVGTAAGAIGGALLGGVAGVAGAEDKSDAFLSAINPLNWAKSGGEYLMGASAAGDRDAGLGMQRALQIATLGAQAIPNTTSTGAPVQSLWDRWTAPSAGVGGANASYAFSDVPWSDAAQESPWTFTDMPGDAASQPTPAYGGFGLSAAFPRGF